MKNCLHVYTGDGKGKTTAAIGLALRYTSHGGNVMLIQFMKGFISGEIRSLAKLGVSIMHLSEDFGFFPFKNKEKVIMEHQKMLENAKKFSATQRGLLILDECFSAYQLDLLNQRELLDLLAKKQCEIVCTGRDAPTEILNLADYITEMRLVKHPYEKGITARRGVEF